MALTFLFLWLHAIKKVKPLTAKNELYYAEGPVKTEGDETERFIDFFAARSTSTYPFKYLHITSMSPFLFLSELSQIERIRNFDAVGK